MAMSIKAARVNAGLSQVQVAEKLGVTQRTVSFWENGKSLPNARHIKDICELYGVHYDDIIFCV